MFYNSSTPYSGKDDLVDMVYATCRFELNRSFV